MFWLLHSNSQTLPKGFFIVQYIGHNKFDINVAYMILSFEYLLYLLMYDH